MSRFSKYQGSFAPHDVYLINEQELEILGGGDWCPLGGSEMPEPPDEEMQAKAERIAKEFGMRITNMEGRWEGWGEMTPDPGDISHFDWEPINV